MMGWIITSTILIVISLLLLLKNILKKEHFKNLEGNFFPVRALIEQEKQQKIVEIRKLKNGFRNLLLSIIILTISTILFHLFLNTSIDPQGNDLSLIISSWILVILIGVSFVFIILSIWQLRKKMFLEIDIKKGVLGYKGSIFKTHRWDGTNINFLYLNAKNYQFTVGFEDLGIFLEVHDQRPSGDPKFLELYDQLKNGDKYYLEFLPGSKKLLTYEKL